MQYSTSGRRYEARVREVGRRIFDLARAAEPTIFQFGWWNQAGMSLLMEDARAQAQLFRFVNVLPILETNEQVVDHLRQYLSDETLKLPGALRLAVNLSRPGSLVGAMSAWAARFGAARMARSYICGSTAPEAIAHVVRLRRQRMAFTMDILGEATTSERRADGYAAAYMRLLESLAPIIAREPRVDVIDRDERGAIPRVNISVKITALYSNVDPIDPVRTIAALSARLRPILLRARELGAFINLDMEQYAYRDLTSELFKTLLMEPALRDWADVGTVVQAYLTDAEDQVADLLAWVRKRGTPITIRLVKGAYWDSETLSAVRERQRIPVWTNKWESDACFERIARTLMENREWLRPALASHNVRSLAAAMVTAEMMGLDPRAIELQMLYGMGDALKSAIVETGHRLRIYTPYGDPVPGMAYLIRRLLENTSNDSFLRQGFAEGRDEDELLRDPEEIGLTAEPAELPEVRRQDYFDDEDADMPPFENVADTGFGSAENRQRMIAALAAVRREAERDWPLRIGGKDVAPGGWIESMNPADPREVLGRVARGGREEAERAVEAAQAALAEWSATAADERIRIVQRIAELTQVRRIELAAAICLECGKSWREADGELSEAIDYCRFYARELARLTGRSRWREVPGEMNVYEYGPVGVTAVIGTWSFPLALSAGMVSAAIVAGNTVVLKPASPAPLVAARWVEVLEEAGLPAGVVNFCPGSGAEVGEALCAHPLVRIVALTGSSATGARIQAACAAAGERHRSFKRLILELGAKNAIIVDEDADLDDAIKGVLASAFGYAGQKCSACSRVIVLRRVYRRFVEQIAEAAAALPIGRPEEPGTVIGPVIDRAAQESILRYIAMGASTCRTVYRGDVGGLTKDGACYVPPTIFADVDPQSPLAQEEIFGPVLAVIEAEDMAHAIEIANGTPYGLVAGMYSRNPRNIERARRRLRCGNLYINRKITGSLVDRQPFGGGDFSGLGHKTGGPDYLLQFMQARAIAENTLRHGMAQEEHSPMHAAHAR